MLIWYYMSGHDQRLAFLESGQIYKQSVNGFYLRQTVVAVRRKSAPLTMDTSKDQQPTFSEILEESVKLSIGGENPSVAFYNSTRKSDQRSSLESRGILEDHSDGADCGSGPRMSLLFQILVVISCTMSIVISMGFGYSLSVVYAQLIRVFDQDRSVVALNQSIYEALLAVGGFLWSYPVSRFGYGYSIMVGGLIGSAALIASSFATNIATVIVLIGALSGAAFGIVYLGPFVVAGQISRTHKTAMIGFVSIGSSVGQFTMSSLMEVFIEEYSWNGALFVIGALCLNAIPFGFIMHISEKRTGNSSKKGRAITQKNVSGQGFLKPHLFKQPLFWILMVNSLILAFTALAESRFLVDLATLKGFDRKTGSFFITMVGVSNLVGGLMGAVSKVICNLSSAGHMTYWILIIAVSHLLVVIMTSYAGLLVASLLNGLCIGNIYAHVAIVLYEVYGEEDYASSFALWNVVKGIGNLLGGTMGGVINDKTGSYDLLFEISIGLSIYYAISFLGICVYRKIKSRLNYDKL